MFNKRNRFTLIELIVVMAVLGILSAIVIPNIKDMREKSEIAAVQSNIRNIQTAVDMFHLDYGYYPTDTQPAFVSDNITEELVSTKEIINFSKDDFVVNYLRETPDKGVSYFIDAWGKVLIDEVQSDTPQIANKSIIKVKKGLQFSLGLFKDGDLYSWGNNTSGQLGLGDNVDYNTPQKVNFFKDKKIRQIEVGHSHSLVLLESGEVYSWGDNDNGQLGLGDNVDYNTPQKIDFFNGNKVVSIESGGLSSYAILETGEVYSWGYNRYGQLGLGDNQNYNTPQIIEEFTDKKISQLKNYEFFTLAQSKDGEVYSFGKNSDGQLGTGDKENKNIPVKINNLNNVSRIEVGYNCSYAILKNGEVYSWGANDIGQLANGSLNEVLIPQKSNYLSNIGVVDLTFGYYTNFALLESGEVYGWGLDIYNLLTSNEGIIKTQPVKFDFFKDKKIASVQTYQEHSFIELEDSTFYTWGKNALGELGLGDIKERTTPTKLEIIR